VNKDFIIMIEFESSNTKPIGDSDGLSYIPLLSNYDYDPPNLASPPKENNNNIHYEYSTNDVKSIEIKKEIKQDIQAKFPIYGTKILSRDYASSLYYKPMINVQNNLNLTTKRSIIYRNSTKNEGGKTLLNIKNKVVPNLQLNNMKSNNKMNDNNNNNNNNNNNIKIRFQKKSNNPKITSPERDIKILKTTCKEDKMFHQFLYPPQSSSPDKDIELNKTLVVPKLCVVGNLTDRSIDSNNSYYNTSFGGSKSARLPLKKKKINNGYEINYLRPNLNSHSQFNSSLYEGAGAGLDESSVYSIYTQVTSKGNTISFETNNNNNNNNNNNDQELSKHFSSHHFNQPLTTRMLLPSEKIFKRNYNKNKNKNNSNNDNNDTKDKSIHNKEMEEIIEQLKFSSKIEMETSQVVESSEKIFVSIPKPLPPTCIKNSSNSPRKENKLMTFEGSMNEIDYSMNKLDYLEMMSIPLTNVLNERENSLNLTKYETSEIKDYKNVYYVGVIDNKVNTNSSLQNDGFDDLNGYYNGGVKDHIGYRYEILNILGQGSFGNVFKCRDHKTGVDVAIKVIRNEKRFVHQSEVELKVLHLLSLKNNKMSINEAKENDNTNINIYSHNFIQLLSSFDFRKHKCFVFPLHDINIYEYLKLHNFQGCSTRFVRRVAIQLLECLLHLESLGVIHCDIKPENVLLRNENNSNIVLIDFGSSCMVGKTLYSYIQSRFYRAPEVIMGYDYSKEIDMWGMACMLPGQLLS
jgi:hypothetical protein